MAWISIAHRIAADELTAVGADSFLTGSAIHDTSRSVALAGDVDSVWLTRERYMRTLAPVADAEQVGLLISLEDAGEAAVRICVRAIDRHGTAIACGFQTAACFTAAGNEAAVPSAIRDRLVAHAEPNTPFAERAASGGAAVASLFPDDILAEGGRVALGTQTSAPRTTVRSSVIFRATSALRASVARRSEPAAITTRRSGLFGAVPEFTAPIIAERGGIAFVFPGVDGYDGQLLRELHAALPYLSSYIDEADAVARRQLRTSFFPLIDAETIAEHDAHLRRCPDLAHFGAFVSGVLFAEALQERGIRPDVLVGHGSGEITALAVAGSFDGRTGLEIIAERIAALDDLTDSTAATFTPTLAERLERSFGKLKLRAPRAQLYSPVARRTVGPDVQLSKFLATHTLLQSAFDAAVQELRTAGCEYFVECGAGGLTRSLTRAPALAPTERKPLREKLDAASAVLAKRAAVMTSQHAAPARSASRATPSPVAITGIGCVLPGARDLDAYWRLILDGESAIRERDAFDTEAWDGISAPGAPTASAVVSEVPHQPHLPFSFDEFSALSMAQRMLAVALDECLPGIRDFPRAEKPRVRCILGASAEGMREFEESSLVETIHAKITRLDVPVSVRDAIAAGFVDMAGSGANANAVGAGATIGSVVERCVGAPVDTMLVDAACASSLYSLDLGMKSLQASECDIAIVGGIFAPGASWQPLYAQLEGLHGSISAPFTREADGVVFGEGVTVLALERLSDAVEGDRVRAVVRGVGLSCDGRKPSVADPSAAGQSLAIQRAYENAAVTPATIQFVEGHGVSDPASDAAEIESLRTIFEDDAPRPIDSVKALIGHTVWAAGAASVAKVCRALHEVVIPSQSPAHAWPTNIGDEPRRAGVSAFGIGGTNAHAVIEAASATYHRALAESTRGDLPRVPVALVGFVDAADGERPIPNLRADVVEQLDRTQRVTAAAVDKTLDALAGWGDHREHVGVIGAVVGRTARAAAATQRVYRDELRRVLSAHASELGVAPIDAEQVAQALHDAIGADTMPITPHTLIGMLPNIAAARVGNLYDLRGPNLAIDAGARSVLEALAAAERWLTGGTADVMLVCLLRPDGNDGVVVASVTTPAFARARGWPVLGELAFGERGKDTLIVRPPRATRTRVELKIRASRPLVGIDELAHAVSGAASGRATIMRWERDERGVAPPLGRLVTPANLELTTPARS